MVLEPRRSQKPEPALTSSPIRELAAESVVFFYFRIIEFKMTIQQVLLEIIPSIEPAQFVIALALGELAFKSRIQTVRPHMPTHISGNFLAANGTETVVYKCGFHHGENHAGIGINHGGHIGVLMRVHRRLVRPQFYWATS